MSFRRVVLATVACILAACAYDPPIDVDLQDVRRWEDTRTLAGDSLAVALEHGETPLRAAAARAMGRIGHANALAPLTRALVDDDQTEVRREAAFALGILAHPDAVEGLVRRLRDEEDVATTAEICLALGRIGREGTAPFLHPIVESPYPRLREAALEALALLEDPQSLATLLHATHDSVPGVVWRAAYALEKVPDVSTHDRLVELTTHEFDLVRRYAIRSLGRIEAVETADHVAGLTTTGADAWHEEARIADTLGRLGKESDVVTARIRSMLEHRTFHVRVAALQAIQRAAWESLTADVLACADDPTVDVRAARLDALAALGADDHAAVFEAALDDPAPIVVNTALTHWASTGSPPALRQAREALAADNPRALRMAGASGLVAAGDAVALEDLVALLQDPDVFVATIAAGGVGARGSEAEAAALLRAADRRDDPSGDLRRAVFAALGEIEATGAVDRLRRAMEEEASPWLRIAARDALETLLSDPVERAALPSPQEIHHSVRPVTRSPEQPALVTHSLCREIVLTTRHGDVVIRPLADEAPQMVETFGRLAAAGRFDGLTFHRVVPDFVVQGGDPTGTGWGDAGFTIRSEWNRESYDRGKVGIAHSGKDTGSCQLFITHAPQPHLDARYTIWGEVVSGMDVVDQIQRGDTFTATAVFDEP